MGGRTERPTIPPSGWVQPLPRSRPRAPTVERWRSHAPRRAAPPEPPSRTRAATFATLRASQRKFSSAMAPPPATPGEADDDAQDGGRPDEGVGAEPTP